MNGQDAGIGPDYRAGGARAPITAGGRVPAIAGQTYKTRLPGPLGANRMERRHAARASVHKTITPAARPAPRFIPIFRSPRITCSLFATQSCRPRRGITPMRIRDEGL